jgi:hypothetical protein
MSHSPIHPSTDDTGDLPPSLSPSITPASPVAVDTSDSPLHQYYTIGLGKRILLSSHYS